MSIKLSDYQKIETKLKSLTKALEDVEARGGPEFPDGTCAKIARAALDYQNAEVKHGTPDVDS